MKNALPLDSEKLFHPRGIAVIGASKDRGRIGGHPIHATLKAGFKGNIYPVNPKHAEVQGLRCYPDVASIDGPCDLAIVAVRAELVPTAIEACGKAGISNAVVLAAGFRETGESGGRIERAMLCMARENGVRVIGPNCQGIVSVHSGVFAAFGSVADELGLRAGAVSAAFQSGGFGYSIVNLAEASGIGFRYCVSSGNETDLTMPELLDNYLDDPGTALAFAYVEGVTDGRALMRTGLKSLEKSKPLLLWKGAKSNTGARAAASHTANLTGSYDIYRTAFDTCGILEVNDVEQIVDLSRVFLTGRLPIGNGVGVLGISGGSGIVFADEAIARGLDLPQFSDQTTKALREVVPLFGSVNNPADVTAGVFNDLSVLTKTIEIVLRDIGVHQLVLLLASMSGEHATQAAQAIASVAKNTDKPLIVGWSGRRSRAEQAYATLEEAGVPILPTPVRAAYAAAAMWRFASARKTHLPRRIVKNKANREKIPPGSGILNEADSKRILTAFNIPVTREARVDANADAAACAAAAGLRFPVAVKVLSTDIPHKSDIGGVRLNVGDEEALRRAASDVVKNALDAMPDAVIEGVLVSEMANGLEMLIGAVNDPTFGPVVTLGLGGIFTEALRDVSFGIAPFGVEEARRMISRLRSHKLLESYRGRPALDCDALAKAVSDVSLMADTLGSRLVELDINPVFVRHQGEGVVAADALISLG
ncbi:acetate--CoA ligase family protein [Roseovarius sp.]|uniref:acetate--CoA ligase family protein n=1 Tax=Roseovarius sp. TaxID=1486281 RepID=UPI003567B67A